MRLTNHIAGLSFIIFLLSSCTGASYNVLYTVGDEERTVNELKAKVPLVQEGQELCIAVNALNEESVQYFRTSRWREGATGIECLYYRVSSEGTIEVPILGQVEVVGLTLVEIEDKLTIELDHLLKEPSVRVRYVDWTVSIMGEVSVPSAYEFDDGDVTIFEAIARAGGLGQFAKRTNVLVVRNTPTGVKHVRLDLTREDIWTSDYYYLHQGDVVMVDSNPARVANAHNITTYGSVIVGLGTIFAILSTR